MMEKFNGEIMGEGGGGADVPSSHAMSCSMKPAMVCRSELVRMLSCHVSDAPSDEGQVAAEVEDAQGVEATGAGQGAGWGGRSSTNEGTIRG